MAGPQVQGEVFGHGLYRSGSLGGELYRMNFPC